MATIPNLSTFKSGRGGPRRRLGGRTATGSGVDGLEITDEQAQALRDNVVRETDNDAASSRMSAVALGYLHDPFAKELFNGEQEIPRRYPIINRGTYVRTTAIDELVVRFLRCQPTQTKQIVSLGAGSDTRFFRMLENNDIKDVANLKYHELDFEDNVNRKRAILRSSQSMSKLLSQAERRNWIHRLHALDLRDLTNKSPPEIPGLDTECPTLLLSECCLCYLAPEVATSVIQYFTMHLHEPLALVLYEPIRPFDAFGKTMVSNLASRGIHLQTLKQYFNPEAQRKRLRLAGFADGQGVRDVRQIWDTEQFVSRKERERIEHLEWLDEVEEWQLLASHYCIAWGWRGEVFGEAWRDLDGSKTQAEINYEQMD